MPPFTPATASAHGRAGGLAPHARRGHPPRGRRLNRPGIPDHQLRGLLADIMSTLREPERGVRSIRLLAAELRVSDRTLRRWLSGEDMPPAPAVRRLQTWLRHQTKS